MVQYFEIGQVLNNAEVPLSQQCKHLYPIKRLKKNSQGDSALFGIRRNGVSR